MQRVPLFALCLVLPLTGCNSENGPDPDANTSSSGSESGGDTTVAGSELTAQEALKQGLEAISRGDAEAAKRLLEPHANDGDVPCIMALGRMYQDGKVIDRDYEQAMAWFVRAFNKRNGEAFNAIAAMYRGGLGVEKNYAVSYALFLTTQMAELGDESVQQRATTELNSLSPLLTFEDYKTAYNYTEEYLKAFVNSDGELDGIPEDLTPSETRLRLREKDWWLPEEREELSKMYQKEEPGLDSGR